MRKIGLVILCVLMAGTAEAGGQNKPPPHSGGDVDVNVRNNNVNTNINKNNVEGSTFNNNVTLSLPEGGLNQNSTPTVNVTTPDVNVAGSEINVTTPDVSVNDNSNSSIQNNSSFEAAPSSAYAYAAQCGTGAGASTMEFSGSISGESQHCKHLRMAAFYEGLYREAGAGGDEAMAQYWYKAMTREGETAQILVRQTMWTGAAKENAADMALPTLLCGAVSLVATPGAGIACAAVIGAKATVDWDRARENNEDLDTLIEDRDFIPSEK